MAGAVVSTMTNYSRRGLTPAEALVAEGVSEVTLLGQNVTAYKWDADLDFAGLLEKVVEVDGLERVRFLTGHPHDMHPHLMDTIGRLEKVCPWLHLPIQSVLRVEEVEKRGQCLIRDRKSGEKVTPFPVSPPNRSSS